jgi:hypothetical protein
MTVRRGFAWLGVIALLELAARWVVYGMAPSSAERAGSLGGQLGGPGFTAVLLVALGVGAALSTALVWLASLGVRERWQLSDARAPGGPPRIAPGPLLKRAVALTLVGWLVFAAVESLIHMQAGMGFHGLECLIGPVHRNALPVIGGLALLASALVSAAGLVLAWMRRTVGRLVSPRAVARGSCRPASTFAPSPAGPRWSAAPRRGARRCSSPDPHHRGARAAHQPTNHKESPCS